MEKTLRKTLSYMKILEADKIVLKYNVCIVYIKFSNNVNNLY